MQQKHRVKPYSLCTVQVSWGSRLWGFKFLWWKSPIPTSVLELSYFQCCLESTFLVVLLYLTGGFSVECVCRARLLPKCPWHQNREEEDRWDNLPGGPPTDRAPCCARCLHQSVTQHHKSLPQHLIVLCHPQCVTCAVWVCCSHDGLSNWLRLTQRVFSFLINRIKNDIHHSHETGFQQRRIIQSTSLVFY